MNASLEFAATTQLMDNRGVNDSMLPNVSNFSQTNVSWHIDVVENYQQAPVA